MSPNGPCVEGLVLGFVEVVESLRGREEVRSLGCGLKGAMEILSLLLLLVFWLAR